jgi:hypothetical protein
VRHLLGVRHLTGTAELDRPGPCIVALDGRHPPIPSADEAGAGTWCGWLVLNLVRRALEAAGTAPARMSNHREPIDVPRFISPA